MTPEFWLKMQEWANELQAGAMEDMDLMLLADLAMDVMAS